ncbi:MAG: hypothetical protein HC915_17930 [Anaerolineae bacterium]|nr:hypothetical protein [Anaerolineae bacterium]
MAGRAALACSLARLSDGLALAAPLHLSGVWWACRGVGCGLGPTVADRDAYPTWQVGFLRDLQGDVLPRYELQVLGMVGGLLTLAIIGGITLRGLLPGRRLALSLALCGAWLLPLENLRVDPPSPALGSLSALALLLVGGWGLANRHPNVASTATQDQL